MDSARLSLYSAGMIDSQYENLLNDVLTHGTYREDRTGTGAVSMFGGRLDYDLSKGFPRITTKFVPMRAVKAELLWFLSGSTDRRELDASIWDEWTSPVPGTPDWDMGPIYGEQWRNALTNRGERIDQISNMLRNLREDPFSRRNIVSCWNLGDLSDMALPPCHTLFQAHVSEGRLSVQVYQRSADMFLGVPFNIASYALLTHMLAQQADLEVAGSSGLAATVTCTPTT